MKRYHFLLIFLLLLTVKSFAQLSSQVKIDANFKMGKLPNGLTYYLRHNEVPKGSADFYIAQKVGSILEEENQRGLAHFLEHMAFNGTKHFPENTIISELEKKGIKFGDNINAYTSFDETVYRLTSIPMKREGILDTALLVLHDWSGCITSFDKDIDDERGVIREEWRTRSSGYLRVQESEILPGLFAGTPYANRLPIGTLDVINNFKHQELRDYYKKWYRPDLQGIVIVGDIDVEKVEAKLKALFSDIPAPVNPAIRNYFQIPDNDKPIVAIASDPEIQEAYARVYWKMKTATPAEKMNRQYFKLQIINNIITNMLIERFGVIREKEKLFTRASVNLDTYSVANLQPAWQLTVIPNDNDMHTALKSGLIEIQRMRKYGFNLNEFEPTIKSFNLTKNEKDYYDRNIIPNYIYPQVYVDYFLKNEPPVDPEWKYNTTKEILNGLTMDTLNFYAKQYMQDRNMAFEITCSGKSGVTLPTKEEILSWWDEAKKAVITPWVKEIKPNELTALIPPAAGKIITTEKDTKPFGFTRWTLSNGAKVLFKNTNYKEADVYIYGYKPGGYSLVSDEDLPSALAYKDVESSGAGIEGVDGRASCTPVLEKNYEWIGSKGTVMDIKILFQSLYINMTRFKKEPDVFKRWKEETREANKIHSVNPKSVYRDTLVSIMSNHHPRAISLTNPAVLEKVDYDKIIRLHKERFGNARDFTFVITGNLNEDSIRLLVETWIGGLPSFNITESIKDNGIFPPKGIVKNHFTKKMETPQSTITIGYTGKIPLTMENKVKMEFMSNILQTIYLEQIREKEGGAYGVGVQGQSPKFSTEPYIFQVSFDTDPNPVKKEKLIGIVYEEIKNMMKQGPTQEMVEKVRENFLKNYSDQRKKEDAFYWFGVSSTYVVFGLDTRNTYEKVVSEITPSQLQDFAKEIFTQGNIIEVVMDPTK